MSQPLQRAAQAHQAALAGVPEARTQARALVQAAVAKVDKTRAALAEAIVQAGRDGMAQVEIIRLSGYTRERVRSILRAGGVGVPPGPE